MKKKSLQGSETLTPTEYAVGLVKGEGGWRQVTYVIHGDKVVERRAKEPDLRAIAVEHFKKEAYERFWKDQ